MAKTTRVLTTLIAAGWAVTALAQPPAPAAPAPAAKPGGPAAGTAPPAMEVPKPAAENDIIKKSAGTWRCEGTGKTPDGQEIKYKASWAIKPIAGGHWHHIVYKRSKMGPMPAFEGHAMIGYNLADKRYTMMGVDNMAGWINVSSTDGAIYTGDAADGPRKSPMKFSFSPGKDKKGMESDRLFDVTMEYQGGSATESCKK